MSEKTIKIPGPDHPITIESNPNRVIVTVAGQIIADTTDALILREAKYPPVQYIPRKNVRIEALSRSETNTYCPYKGEAAYFHIPAGGDRARDAIWTYEAPYDAVNSIRDYVAFYPDRVDTIIEQSS